MEGGDKLCRAEARDEAQLNLHTSGGRLSSGQASAEVAIVQGGGIMLK